MKTAYLNGTVYTVDASFRRAEAFLVENGLFVAVGSDNQIRGLAGEGVNLIDLHKKTVLPGFNDSHLHLLNYAYGLTKFEMSGLAGVEEIVEEGKRYIESRDIPDGSWILGRGWNQTFLKEGRPPLKEELDQLSDRHPICLTRVCEHVIAVNTKALKEAGIDENTPDPEGGEIERDESGRLTGVLKETARYLVYRAIPPKSVEEIKAMMLGAIQTALAFGVTSVQTDDFETFSDKDWRKVIQAYEELKEEGRLNIRIYEQCLLPELGRLKEFLDAGFRTGHGDDRFKIGPLKLLTDGSLGGRTAYLNQPYHDAPDQRGIAVLTCEELDQLIITAHIRGMQLVCHGIGDAAINRILDSYEKAGKIMPKEDSRMGIIHVQITDDETIRRFERQKILAYLEPICLNSDLHIAEQRVGKKRSSTSYQYRTFCDREIVTPMSSDCPVDSLNPFDSMYVGVNRTDFTGYPEGGWRPEEKLTVEQMVRGFTVQGAMASFEEDRKGTIEAGKLADFIILSEDPFRIAPEELRRIRVEETYLEGVRVYKRRKID